MADLAYVSGAVWQQGYHHGRPSAARRGTEQVEPVARIVAGSAEHLDHCMIDPINITEK